MNIGSVNVRQRFDRFNDIVVDGVAFNEGQAAIHVDMQIDDEFRADVFGHHMVNVLHTRHSAGGLNDLLAHFLAGNKSKTSEWLSRALVMNPKVDYDKKAIFRSLFRYEVLANGNCLLKRCFEQIVAMSGQSIVRLLRN